MNLWHISNIILGEYRDCDCKLSWACFHFKAQLAIFRSDYLMSVYSFCYLIDCIDSEVSYIVIFPAYFRFKEIYFRLKEKIVCQSLHCNILVISKKLLSDSEEVQSLSSSSLLITFCHVQFIWLREV